MKRILAILLILAMLPIPATFAREAAPAAIPDEAFDAVTADVWSDIEAIEAQVTAKRGKSATASDYAAIVDDVIAAVEASDTYLEGSVNRNGAFFTWRTTDGVACGYSPRLRAQIHQTAIRDADPEDLAGVETSSYAVKGGSPSSTSVAVFQPYYGIDSSFKTTYSNEGATIAQAMGGTSTTYKTTSATIDAIADAFESCAVVIFDSHGDTDYANPSNDEDFVSRANTSYICLQSGTGITSEDMANVTGTYGTYQHAYYAGSYGSMKYYCVDGTAIANHMEKTAPHNMLWSAICLGMATDGLHAALRAKGVEVAYGYSQSVTFDYDYQWEDVFWDNMIAGKTVAQSAAAMKSQVGDWDYISEYTTITSARNNFAAFPIFVSSEDVYPGKGNVDNRQTVNSTWTLKGGSTEPTTAPTEPTTAPTEPTTAPSGNEYVLATSLKDGDEVIIYNAGAGMAMSEDAVATNYRAGAAVTVSNNKIVTNDSKIVWKVKASGNGFTFANDAGETLSATKGLSFATTDNVWAINPATTANSVYIVSTTATGSSGDPKYVEWYDKYTEFSTYYYNTSSEAIFAMQLFVKSGSSVTPTTPTEPTTPVTPTEPTAPVNPTEPTTAPSGNEYVLATSLKNGDEVIIYNAGAGMAMSEDAVATNYRAGTAVTVSNNKIVTDDSKIVWKVTASGSGFTFANDAGETLSATKGLSFAATDNVWAVNPATTANSVYIVSTTATGSSGDPKYVEWYDKYTEFSTYYYNTSSEAIFAMQLFVKSGSVAPTEPTTAPTEPTVAPTEPTTAPIEPTTAPITDGSFAKVTADQTDWSGKYLIVYESSATDAIVYCGSDVQNDTSSATISGNAIAYQNGMAVVTVKKSGSGYSMQLASGEYIDSKPLDAGGKEQNGIVLSDTEAELTLQYIDGSANVVSATGSVLRYNASATEGRFRFYKSTTYTNQKAVQLYKLTGELPQPTEPTTAPTQPTTAPTEPTTAPTTAPTVAPSGLPFADGDCVVIYNAASGVIFGYEESNDADDTGANYTYWNISTEAASVSGTTLKADFTNAGTFYAVINDDGTVFFLDQYDYDQSEDADNPDCYYLAAEAPDTYYDSSTDYAAFELVPVEGGYLLKNVADNSYFAVENGVIVAKALVSGDPSFVFLFAIWEGDYEETGSDTANIICTLVEAGTDTPTEPTTAPTEPTTAPTEPTTAPSGNEYVLTTTLKNGDEVIIYNAGAKKAMSEDAVSTNYRAGADVTVSNNKIVTDDSKIVWKVTKTADGYTFTNDNGETLSATKGLSFATTDNVWAINPAATANSVYIVSTTATGSSGDPKFIEWYERYTEFSTYYYSEASEAIFAMQLFVRTDSVAPTEPTTAPTEPTTAPTEPTTAPTEPTTAPTQPTTAPTEPTTAPTQPTTAPTEPTTAPTQPTSAPTEPTTAPTEPAIEYTVTVRSADEALGRVTIMDNVVSATPDNGYYAAGFLLEPADAATVLQSGNLFYLSNITADCTLTVYFRAKEAAELRFSVPAGCTAKRISTSIGEPTALSAPKGEVRADAHKYEFLGWTLTPVRDENEKPVYYTDSYTPEAAVTTLYALYTYDYRGETWYTTILQMDTCLAKQFNDVDVKAWYHEALDFVLEYQYMNGVGDFKFDPAGKLTRGMMVTILYRLEEREGKFSHPFDDVKMGAWYDEAVAWAYANGIVNGTSAKTFDPNAPITREQTAAMLYRYAKWSGEDVTPKGSLMNFVDADKVSAFARDPMRWAVGEGIINGKGKVASTSTTTDKNEPTEILDPLGTATRAEIAQILYGWLA